MNDQEDQNLLREKIGKRGKRFIIAGLFVLVGGIVLFIVGISVNDFNLSPALAVPGGFMTVIGFGIAAVGLQFLFASKTGKITKFFATETAPAMKTTSEAVTDGFASGLKKHGMGIGEKEVIKVKCRNCGYLETEDAEFCSKCGQPM
ncbi:MAG: hypothetical protein JW776_02195 [Candidatus Lokiarchaeota archaeon]|nr:hypothetical protein [Candidatus Lokiarchaeota archaeon]